jgi:hypothetical protein
MRTERSFRSGLTWIGFWSAGDSLSGRLAGGAWSQSEGRQCRSGSLQGLCPVSEQKSAKCPFSARSSRSKMHSDQAF